MTDDQHPWPEELREMLNDWLDDAYESTEPRPNADALLAALAASPYAVVRRDEYGALRSFWSYTWRSALRAAYEQVRRGDGGERG